MVGKVIESTVLLILAFLVISNAQNFSTAVSGFASGYGNIVRVLQGR